MRCGGNDLLRVRRGGNMVSTLMGSKSKSNKKNPGETRMERLEMEILTVDELPPVVRGAHSKYSEERAQLLEFLSDGKAHIIPGVEDKAAHNRLQQRIRNLAKSHGIAVTVRYNPVEKVTSFGPPPVDEDKPKKTIKRNTKANTE